MSTDQEEAPDLAFHDADEVEGPDDVSFPGFAHHLQVRSELTKLAKLDVIDGDEGDRIFDDWIADRNE